MNRERVFHYEELFFSRTTSRGVIQSGNSVFKRISGFDWDDLINKPHSLIRHPDMPRGVFYLFWEVLKSGKPIGAYVKNKARTGEFYWVYALAFPIDAGYVSLRLKPSSDYFDITQKVYAKLIEQEQTEKISPKDSMSEILQSLKALGFPQYEDFMTTCLIAELKSRNQKLMIQESDVLKNLDQLVLAAKTVNSLSEEINSVYNQYTQVPLNMEILASSLGTDGVSLSVVANNYEKMVNEIHHKIESFLKLNDAVVASVSKSQFQVASSILQKEMIHFFENEKEIGPINAEEEVNLLKKICRKSADEANSILNKVEVVLGEFQSSCAELRQMSLGLEIVRVTGKIEASKVSEKKVEVFYLLDELNKFKLSLSSAICELDGLSASMKKNAEDILSILHEKM